MLIVPPIPFLRRRSARASAPAPSPPPPPPPPPPPSPVDVVVVAVTVASATELEFEFSPPVTCDGTAAGEPIVDMPFFGWQGAQCSQQIAANVVRFASTDDPLVAGISWQINSVPDGLDLHGATMPLPQSGVVG